MLDFLLISVESKKKDEFRIYPKFIVMESTDLMIRGGDFYAIWDDEKKLWSTKEQDAIRMIDNEIRKYAEEHIPKLDGRVSVSYMWDSDSGVIDKWHRYCQKQMRDSYQTLDENLIFSNTKTEKTDYASKRLPYPLEKGQCPAYDKLISTLYSEEERRKIEWAIGSVITGDSKTIQKFVVLYGAAGTGKSTILNIIQQLFEGYYSVFDAKALGSSNNAFALEAFKNNPLVAIQHDGDLSRIEDNTRINSLVSHELMTVNEKFKSAYSNRFISFLFMGTNKPVRITDAKSGLIRRLIDVSPSGNRLPYDEYVKNMDLIKFELGAIAMHCRKVYLGDPNMYDSYIPTLMMGASNDFYNFVMDYQEELSREKGVTLKTAWEFYKKYCDEAKVPYPLPRMRFKEELKNYYEEYYDRSYLGDGTRVRNFYVGFKYDDADPVMNIDRIWDISDSWDELKESTSIFDEECKNYSAQYANEKGTPTAPWDNVTTVLSDIQTDKLHYVRLPENHIVIDFDLKNAQGEKDLRANLKAAGKWPETYLELSKSGKGVHLHYIYNGDVSKLSRVYDSDIEIKIFTGKSSLRRKLTECVNNPIRTINSGLPMKGDVSKMVNFDTLKNERSIRTLIKKNLNKEVHSATKPSIDFISKILDDAYNSGMKYDVSDMRNAIFQFAAGSTNNADYCIKQISKMKFKSKEEYTDDDIFEPVDDRFVFFDIEVFPNLFLVNWKYEGKDSSIVRMINPQPDDIRELVKRKLIGFNCRRYDNHILYARLLGESVESLYRLSQNIIENGVLNHGFVEAYSISYTDIYDFASAGNKKSLKKLEIEMGIRHKELGLPWDEPVPESKWEEVAEYCDNDVLATEAAFNYLSADWTARQILADLAGKSVNHTTNSLTTQIIFSGDKNTRSELHWRNLGEPIFELEPEMEDFLTRACPVMMAEPFGEAGSKLPYFPGYKYEGGTSTYKGEVVGEGGYVYSEPGVYYDVALLDVSSMHPHSVIAEYLFGKYTEDFLAIVKGRVNIKHEEFDRVSHMFDGRLKPYIKKVVDGEMTSKQLANALKTAINSVYGLTSAHFDNDFLDPRNKDNIVAKRGALFMLDLKEAVQAKGFTVAHIKTDSIKIPNATPDIIKFVMEFGQKYGYTFEHEATYDRMALVNKSVYIAKYAMPEKCEKLYGYIPSDCRKSGGMWTPTGAQFAEPYVFKKLFSKEKIDLNDLAVTKSVKTAIYLDMNENLEDVSELEALYAKKLKDPNVGEDELEKMSIDIAKGHDYKFIGRVGLFFPIKPGSNGGLLLRANNKTKGGYSAVTDTTGYRWLEYDKVVTLNKEDYIDLSYFDRLVDAALDVIGKYIDPKVFIEG